MLRICRPFQFTPVQRRFSTGTAFGTGLSYTSFAYSGLNLTQALAPAIASIRVKVRVRVRVRVRVTVRVRVIIIIRRSSQ